MQLLSTPLFVSFVIGDPPLGQRQGGGEKQMTLAHINAMPPAMTKNG
jgi:hypothetical protein